MDWWLIFPGGVLLEQLLKWTGVSIALAGAVLSAPHGTRRLMSVAVTRIRTWFFKAWDWIGTKFPRLRRPIPASIVSPAGIASSEAHGTLTASGYQWSPGADLETRVDQLKQRMDQLTEQTKISFERVYNSINDHDAELQRIEQLWQETGVEFNKRLRQNDDQAAEVDAAGLPVIAAGVFLSGVPTELALIPPIGWVLLVAAVITTAWAIKKSKEGGAWRNDL